MMNLRKNTLGLAVAAVVVGGGASLAQAQVALNPSGLGQVLIYPYLVAQSGGWSSFMHVTNTSGDTVAAKVRFRRAASSDDAYDFILVLSPYDMWTASIETQGGLVGFRPTDNSCTAPVIGKDIFMPMFQQSAELYAEVLTMGVSPSSVAATSRPISVAAKHGTNGMPVSCDTVASAFATNATIAAQAGEFKFNLNTTGASNFLTGKFDLVNVGLGQSGAGRAVAVANFGAPPAGNAAIVDTNMWGQNDNPQHPTLAEGANGLSGLNAVLTRTAVINEWVLNPGLGELSSWIVTFPTKLLTTTAINTYNGSLQLNQGRLVTFGNVGPADTKDCVRPAFSFYNREEKALIIGSGGNTDLCNEANVINFKAGAIDSSTVLKSSVAVTFDLSAYSTGGVLAGWLNLGMPATAGTALTNNLTQTTIPAIWSPASVPGELKQVNGPVGRPAVGFILTARTSPADAVLYDHAYLP